MSLKAVLRATCVAIGVASVGSALVTGGNGFAWGASGQDRPPAKIFAANCGTCHGARGLGGHQSWANPQRWAHRIAWGMDYRSEYMEEYYRFMVRNGRYHEGEGFISAMPAFGPDEISDSELDALIRWLLYAPPYGGAHWKTGVPPPPRPKGRQILVEITDEAPWFRDDGTDARDAFGDRRRVVMSEGDYIKVVNRGKTWHTVTSSDHVVDTGFIGPAGHKHNGEEEEVGYYYLELSELQAGAWKYFCKLHPYMQVEIVTPGFEPMPLTQASKIPLPPPAQRGLGEVWVGLQTYANEGGPDGAIQVINATNWTSSLITQVGNNPHNGWFGTAADMQGRLRNISLWANWHDVGVTVIDADTKRVLGNAPVGAANAHVMTAPNNRTQLGADRWFVTVMGSNKVQEVDPFKFMHYQEPTIGAISQADGVNGRPGMSPHGLWFADDGDHFLTANTLANTVSLYSVSKPWSDGEGRSGIGCELDQVQTGGRVPLAVSVMNPGNPSATIYRGFSNNAATGDISVFEVRTAEGNEGLIKVMVGAPFGNAAGNIALRDLTATPIRWASMPIQCAVSPPDATEHGRYMVVCNKASFNVSVIALDSSGNPVGIYTFPAGLGAHGVAFGRKKMEGWGRGDRIAYFAYVTNTFENYVSVYDLELLERMRRLERMGRAPREFRPGGARERVRLEGYAAQLLTGRETATVPITLLSPDARGVVHVGDIALSASPVGYRSAYLKEHVWVNLPGYGMVMLDLDVRTDTGAMGVFCRPLPPPW